MSNQQLLMGSLSGSGTFTPITYTKTYTLCDTVSGSGVFIANTYARTFDNDVLHISVNTTGGGVPDQRRLYSSPTTATYITYASSNEYLNGLYGESTTPPGWGIYTDASSSSVNRWNIDNVNEYVTATTQLSRFTWDDDAQALFCLRFNGSYTRVVKLSSFNWAAHTCTTDTAFGPTYSTDILNNGCLIQGRVYVCSDNSINTGRMGWVDTSTGSYTELVDYAQDTGTGIVCASDYIGTSPFIVMQCGDTGNGNRVDFYNTAGSRTGQVTLAAESTTGYDTLEHWVHDRVNNYIWVKRAGAATVYVIDATTGLLHDTWTSSDFPSSGTGLQLIGPVGAASGGIFALIGSPLNKLYKLGG